MLGGVVTRGMDFLRDFRAIGLGSALVGVQSRFGVGLLHISVPGVGLVSVRKKDSDYDTLRQVFVLKHYAIGNGAVEAAILSRYRSLIHSGKTPLIIDAGANVGFAALWFTKLYPQAKIVCIEPDPQNFAILQSNVSGFKNIDTRHAAIGSNPGFVEISNNTGLSWASETTRSDTGTVPIVTMDQIIASVSKSESLIVKIDIEGFEDDLFSANLGWLDEACAVFIEPHDWMKPHGRTSRSFQKAFGERGFGMFLRGENVIYVDDRYLPDQVTPSVEKYAATSA